MKEYISKHLSELKTMAYAIFLFLNIDPDVVKILMFLMAIDTAFGIWKSQVLGKTFSFKLLLFGLTTKAFVLLIPMTLALVGKGLKHYDFTPMVDAVLKILVVAEGFSIFTSAYVIRTKKPVKDLDIVTLLLSSIRKGFLKLLRMFLVKIENPETLINEMKPESETIKTDNDADNTPNH